MNKFDIKNYQRIRKKENKKKQILINKLSLKVNCHISEAIKSKKEKDIIDCCIHLNAAIYYLNQLSNLDFAPAMEILYCLYLNEIVLPEIFDDNVVHKHIEKTAQLSPFSIIDTFPEIADYTQGIYWLKKYIQTKSYQSDDFIGQCKNARYLLAVYESDEDIRRRLMKIAALYDNQLEAQIYVLKNHIELTDEEKTNIYINILQKSNTIYFVNKNSDEYEKRKEFIRELEQLAEKGNEKAKLYIQNYRFITKIMRKENSL